MYGRQYSLYRRRRLCSRGRCHRCIPDSPGHGVFRCTHHRHRHRRLRGTQHRRRKRSEHRHRRSCRIHRYNRRRSCKRRSSTLASPVEARLPINAVDITQAYVAVGADAICLFATDLKVGAVTPEGRFVVAGITNLVAVTVGLLSI